MMKKQQWMMFKHVFSMINSSSSLSSSRSSSSSISIFNNNNNVLRRRPFCCSITTTTTTTPPVSNKKEEFNMLLEKKHPLLLVPYDHITPKEYVLCPPNIYDDGDYYNVCDGTFGFINLFFHDDDDDDDDDQQLIINKKKKKKKKVYDVLKRSIVHLPPFATPLTEGFILRHPASVKKVVTNTITTTTNSTTLPAAAVAANTVVVMAIQGDLYGSLSFCRTSTGNGTTPPPDETTAAAWIEIPAKIPVSTGHFSLSDKEDNTDEEEEHPEIYTYEVIDGVAHWVTIFGCWADVTFYKGNFYTVDPWGMVGVVKGLDGPSPFVQFLINSDLPNENQSHTCYLVESSTSSSSSSSSGGGDLLMVMRNLVDGQETKVVLTDKTKEEEEEEEIFERPYRTNGFRVLKLDLNGPSWEEVTDLGEDCALFVGYNHSFSLSASKIPGCRGNCIYFTDSHHDCNEDLDSPNGGHDIGVYKLEDASFEKLDYETCSSQLIMPPPVWYVPN